MPETCIVCGDPEFMRVDDRPFCETHAWIMVSEIESTIDHLKRNQWSAIVERFTTIGDTYSFKRKQVR